MLARSLLKKLDGWVELSALVVVDVNVDVNVDVDVVGNVYITYYDLITVQLPPMAL